MSGLGRRGKATVARRAMTGERMPGSDVLLPGETRILTAAEARAERKAARDARNAVMGRKHVPNIGAPRHESGGIALVDNTYFGKFSGGIKSTIVKPVEVMAKKKGKLVYPERNTVAAWESALDGLLYVASSVLADPEYKDHRREVMVYVAGKLVKVKATEANRMSREEATRLYILAAKPKRAARFKPDRLELQQLLKLAAQHKR